ncbi:hypothetical protein KUTeg_003822 [Tegillarca granosa]|uniref:NWD1/2-like winged helix-turn-helix domain-containing protein n=1 Tax=Tegillarca granosa TaxID=220873 RepID=A0ABQ9FRF1_TEGGR|nr:hypothetical protein KUTeg_003822 [Tegillarca granosa]
MLAGSLKNLPQLPHSVVRIFLSSTFSGHTNPCTLSKTCIKYNVKMLTFSDMRAERNTLAREVYPKLKEICSRYDLDFQVVDMRWGVTEDSQNDHSVEKICLLEVENCQRVSLGPNFVVSMDYLYKLISGDRYGFRPIPTEIEMEEFESLLQIAKEYQLEDQKLMETWYLLDENAKPPLYVLQPIRSQFPFFGDYSPGCEEPRKKDSENWRKTFAALQEVLRKAANAALKAKKITSQQLHQYFLSGYREFTVPWKHGGINPKDHKDHSEYMNKFCSNFIQDVTNMVQLALHEKEEKIRTSEYYSDYQEILHHLHFCSMKCQAFCGQEESLLMAKEYIFNDTSRKPFILHAPSGAGKTSVMAMIMNSMSEWFKGKEHICVIRFLGTSPDSINIYDVLLSVCGQLADNVKLIMEPVAYRNMKNLIEYFPRFLRRTHWISCRKQMTHTLACGCPLHFLSMSRLFCLHLPEEHGILNFLKQLIPDEQCFYRIPALPDQTGREIIDKFLALKHRTLNREQEKFLLKTFTASPSPLFLKLLLDEAINWHSYTPFHQINLADSIQDAISQLFQNLENKFGQVITSHALGFITIGYNGISEIEIEDALSCDDEALDDVYRYHNPPVDGIVRVPPVLWARIRYDLREYLVERISFGKHTLNWYHRQFIETARARYATGPQAEKLHAIMAETFMAEDGVLRDIKLTRRKITIPNADRQVTPKPMDPKNKRKLGCLPYHIIHAGNHMTDLLAKQSCFFVFEDELTQFLDKKEDEEIQILRLFFSVCKSDLSQPTKLAVNLLSFIDLDQEHVSLRNLLKQAEEYLSSSSKPTLIPVYPGLAPRRDTSNAFLESMEDCEAILSESSEILLIQTSGKQNEDESKDIHAIFNAITGNLVSVTLPEISNPEFKT